MSEIPETLMQSVKQLEDLMSKYQGVGGITAAAENLMPKYTFAADHDGHKVDVSLAVNGRAVVLFYHDDIKAASVFNELKNNKKGFFKRIFST